MCLWWKYYCVEDIDNDSNACNAVECPSDWPVPRNLNSAFTKSSSSTLYTKQTQSTSETTSYQTSLATRTEPTAPSSVPTSTPPSNLGSMSERPPSASLSKAAKAGIGVGVVIFVWISLGLFAWCFWRRKRRQRPTTTEEVKTPLDPGGIEGMEVVDLNNPALYQKPELSAAPVFDHDHGATKLHMSTQDTLYELDSHISHRDGAVDAASAEPHLEEAQHPIQDHLTEPTECAIPYTRAQSEPTEHIVSFNDPSTSPEQGKSSNPPMLPPPDIGSPISSSADSFVRLSFDPPSGRNTLSPPTHTSRRLSVEDITRLEEEERRIDAEIEQVRRMKELREQKFEIQKKLMEAKHGL